MVDGALRISLGGGSDMEGGHWPADLGFTDVDNLETVGGVGGGESNLGDAELEILHDSFCFFITFFVSLFSKQPNTTYIFVGSHFCQMLWPLARKKFSILWLK